METNVTILGGHVTTWRSASLLFCAEEIFCVVLRLLIVCYVLILFVNNV